MMLRNNVDALRSLRLQNLLLVSLLVKSNVSEKANIFKEMKRLYWKKKYETYLAVTERRKKTEKKTKSKPGVRDSWPLKTRAVASCMSLSRRKQVDDSPRVLH